MKDLLKQGQQSRNTGTSQANIKLSKMRQLNNDILEVCINLKFSLHLTRFGNKKMCEKVVKFILG